MLKALGNDAGFLKAGFLGFQKSGKTFTATQLAIGVRAEFADARPLAIFDTEGGSGYIAALVKEATGKSLVGFRGRSFRDLMGVARECEREASVLIVDSVSHVWRELCEGYLRALNESLAQRGKRPRTRLEFQDWASVKRTWAEWTDWYLTSAVHVVICGRSGYEYDFEVNEESGKKELVKTGTKMRVEGEFGYEPSLLVEMERVKDDGKILHRATILGDRFGLIDGKEALNPGYEFFAPHVRALNPSAHAPVDTSVKTKPEIDENGDDDWYREKRQRTILAEEIQGEMLRRWPGQTAAEKSAKADALEKFFDTRSWTKIESMHSDALRRGLEGLRAA